MAGDSFKGSVSSEQFARACGDAIRRALPGCEAIEVPIGDGGEGTASALTRALGGTTVSSRAMDPLMRPITASYGIHGSTAFIDMAAASGLTLLSPTERDPMRATTFGTGQLMLDAARRGCKHIIIGLGGSATCDGGIGMLQALGFTLKDANVQVIAPGAGGGALATVRSISPGQGMKGVTIEAACDVRTSFLDAASTFAPQKGASPAEVALLAQGMAQFAGLTFRATGINIADMPGSGAAGGLGGALAAYLHATLAHGIDLVLSTVHFDDTLRGADLVITGEGHMDRQTVMGKTPWGVLQAAKRQGIPVIALVGGVEMCPELESAGFERIIPVTPADMSLAQAMQPTEAMSLIGAAMTSVLDSK